MKIIKLLIAPFTMLLQARKNFYTWVNSQPCINITNGGLI